MIKKQATIGEQRSDLGGEGCQQTLVESERNASDTEDVME